MNERICHSLDVCTADGRRFSEVILSANAAHWVAIPYTAKLDCIGCSVFCLFSAPALVSLSFKRRQRLRNICDWAQRCMGSLSQPIQSLRARNEPSGFCQS